MTPAHPAAATLPESAARLIGRFYFGTNVSVGSHFVLTPPNNCNARTRPICGSGSVTSKCRG